MGAVDAAGLRKISGGPLGFELVMVMCSLLMWRIDVEIDGLQLSYKVLMRCIHGRDVTFLCGRGGVCALGAVAAKHLGDDKLLRYYLAKFKEVSWFHLLCYGGNVQVIWDLVVACGC